MEQQVSPVRMPQIPVVRLAVLKVADKGACVAFNMAAYVCVCVHSRVLQTLRTSPSRKHRPGPPKDELYSPPGNGAEKWRRDGQKGMGGR